MFYPDELVEQVRESSDIVDIIGSYVHLTRRGTNYVGLCPFHNEKTGSFSVNANMQIFKCFGCGKAGNVFTFLMEYDNLSFPEALKTLADRAGIALPETEMSDEEKQRRSLREKLLEINKEAATYYYAMLRSEEGRHAYGYLKDRGLSDETMKAFGLGFAGKYSDGLYKFLKKKGYSDDILNQTGLFTMSEKGAYDKFWNRVMFPIMDKNGKVIAFGGRLTGSAENAPKYLNSPETRVFLKGNNLFGMNIAKHSHKNYLLLCEGYMDVISLHQAGFTNAVASLGTALTPQQAKLIAGCVKEVILTYDSDGAGVNAALRAIPILKAAGITPKVLDMRPYKDPDEFIKALGAEAYEQRISEASSAFFFETETMRTRIDADNPAEKTDFHHEIARKLARIGDEIERANYIEAASKQYNIDHGSLTRLVNKLGREEQQKDIAEETMEREKQARKAVLTPEKANLKTEELVISFIANNKELADIAGGLVTAEDFENPLCKSLFNEIFNLYEANGSIVHARLVNHFEEVSDQERVAGILDASLYEENIDAGDRKKAFADLLVRMKREVYEKQWQLAVNSQDALTVQKLVNYEEKLSDLRNAVLRA